MSVSWSVTPIIPEALEWLRESGCEVPEEDSRYPTLDETLTVLNSFEGLPVKKENVSYDLWTLIIGTIHTDQYAHLLGNVDADGLYDFHFFGSGCQEETMVEILKRLAVVCGPLVIYGASTATPLIVTSDIEVEAVLADWRERIRQRYSDAG